MAQNGSSFVILSLRRILCFTVITWDSSLSLRMTVVDIQNDKKKRHPEGESVWRCQASTDKNCVKLYQTGFVSKKNGGIWYRHSFCSFLFFYLFFTILSQLFFLDFCYYFFLSQLFFLDFCYYFFLFLS